MSLESLLTQLLGRDATTAARAVAEAMNVAEQADRQGSVGVRSKDDASPVTVADFAVQAVVSARLATAFPNVPLLAEENASQLRDPTAAGLKDRVLDIVCRFEPRIDSDRVLASIDRGCGIPGQQYWTLDPIDGTKGCLRGRQYAVALALVQGADVVIGILGCPRLSLRGPSIDRTAGEPEPGTAIAVRGRGAWWVIPEAKEITRLYVSARSDPSHARVLHSFETAHSDVAQLEPMLQALGASAAPVLLDSQAKHVLLAAHRADLLLRFPTTPCFRDAVWDHAAGALLVSEAGGQVTDLAGQPLDFSTGRRLVRNSGLLASNGWLHEAALRAVEASRLPSVPAGAC